MKYFSTNRKSDPVSLKEAVFQGLPPDNGLYMPEAVPRLSPEFLNSIQDKAFTEIALEVTSQFVDDDIDQADLWNLVQRAFNFEVPLYRLGEGMSALELFHGPTLAFKDFGARFMARLMGHYLEESNQEIDILVATSGDTGSAVGHGFWGVEGIRVTLLYPKGKVSLLQEKQLTTLGGNVEALEVHGTFDDCQKMVKQAFLDPELGKHFRLTSANSINIARLIPQSLYYFYAYARTARPGQSVVFSVPSGNFGNLCGGLLAKKMGLPVAKFIAATNLNHIVPDYLASGLFEPKPSIATISNAMDVGNPSNFARIMDLYQNKLSQVKSDIAGAWSNEEQTRHSMAQVYQNQGYLMCPHTAIAYQALKEYRHDPSTPGIFLSTAHPAKFRDVVEETTGAIVQLPPALQSAMEARKLSTSIGPTLEDLKQYLLRR